MCLICSFLFSFLVGIHKVDKSVHTERKGYIFIIFIMIDFKNSFISSTYQVNDRSIFKSHCGGILSEDGTEIYYVAIIDILCQYDKFKMGERLLKSIIHDPVRFFLKFLYLFMFLTNFFVTGTNFCYAT